MTTFTMASIHNAYTSITTTHTTEVTMTYTHNVANEIALLEVLVAADNLPVKTAQDWAEEVAYITEEAQYAYGRVLRTMGHAKYNPLSVNLTSYAEDEVNLTLIIEELESMGLSHIAEHCITLHSQMVVVFEGVLIAQADAQVAKARAVYAKYNKVFHTNVNNKAFNIKAIEILTLWVEAMNVLGNMKAVNAFHSLKQKFQATSI